MYWVTCSMFLEWWYRLDTLKKYIMFKCYTCICTMTRFIYMKQLLKILMFFLFLSYIEIIIVSSMKTQTFSLSLFNLFIECLYGLQKWEGTEIKMENNMYTQEKGSQIMCELQPFYNLQNNALTPSVFSCIIDVHVH